MILYVTGMPGSGKTTVAQSLEARGFRKFEMSDVIKDMMRAEGIEITGPNTRTFAVALRGRHGPDFFARKLLDRLSESELKDDIVISGGRSKEEIAFFKANLTGFVPISIEASLNLRFERLKTLGGTFGHTTYQDFLAREAIEKSVGVEGAIASTEHRLDNNGTMQELEDGIDRLIALIRAARRPAVATAAGVRA